MEVNGWLNAAAVLPPTQGNIPDHPLKRRLGGTRSQSGCFREVTSLLLLSDIQGCIQKFQDSTCKKKFAYLGC